MLPSHPSLLSAALVSALFAFGCGGPTTVPVEIVRPPLIDARAHGGTLTVEGFAPGLPDYEQVAGQVGKELRALIGENARGQLQLRPSGGGLMVSGRVERYDSNSEQRSQQAQCNVRFNDGEVQRMQRRPCTQAWIEWTANVSIILKVRSAAGVVLYHRRLEEMERDKTGVVQDAMPTPPNLHATLRQLRHRIIKRMGRVVVPHRVEASATFYGCPESAAALCKQAVKHFAASRLDEALATYEQAEKAVRAAGGESNASLADLAWNRAMVARYARRFDRAIDELEKAHRLDADRQRFVVELTVLKAEQRDHATLIEPGLDKVPPRGH